MKLSDFKKLKLGDRVKISKSYREFFDEHGFGFCCTSGGLTAVSSAEEYFVRKAIGQGLPYTAVATRHMDHGVNEDGDPGVEVALKVGTITSTTIVSYKDLVKVKYDNKSK